MDDNRGESDINSEQKDSPHGMVNTTSIVDSSMVKVNLRDKQIVNICCQIKKQYISY